MKYIDAIIERYPRLTIAVALVLMLIEIIFFVIRDYRLISMYLRHKEIMPVFA